MEEREEEYEMNSKEFEHMLIRERTFLNLLKSKGASEEARELIDLRLQSIEASLVK